MNEPKALLAARDTAGTPAMRDEAIASKTAGPWPLLLARACAWSLLLAGWVGIGALALALTGGSASALALVALWLLALGAVAAMPRPLALSATARAPALLVAAAAAAAAMWLAPRGGGIAALIAAVLAWAALTALASGVVRALRLQPRAVPRPPVASAALGALAAGAAVGDPADAMALSLRLAAFAVAVGVLLAGLQWRAGLAGAARPGCRAGLFDCSLPAWPAGAWREVPQWPTLLAGLAMLPMMAELPLLASWCRSTAVGPAAMLWLHLAAMFLPAWLLNDAVARWPLPRLSLVCALLLGGGAGFVALAPAPWDWAGLAALHGAAWSLAWSGLLWAPARRGSAGSSPLAAAAGYALLTAAFGLLIETAGARGAAAAHAALGGVALAAWAVAVARGVKPSAA